MSPRYIKWVDTLLKPGEAKTQTLLELRAGEGHQTVFPGSVHESGEDVLWTPDDCDGTEGPGVVDPADLERRAELLAQAALLARHHGIEAARAWLSGGPYAASEAVLAVRRAWLGIPEPSKAKARAKAKRHPGRTGDLAEAVARFNAAHPLELPRSGGECPMCGHKGCFGHLPQDPQRWSCFSASHSGGGVPPKDGAGPWTGDALDLEAHAAGLGRVEMLRRAGVLS